MKTSIENYSGFLPKISDSFTGLLVILVILLIIIVFVVIIYRIYMIRQINKKEYWLPVVADGGRVIGRIARSASMEKPGIYQHPLIRILTYKSGNIYLSPRTYDLCPDFGKFDHPFECMMEYGYSVEETLEKMQKEFFPNSQHPKFLLKYKHENKIGNWQVLLYVLTIQDENELKNLDKVNGKFWTLPQIRENLGKSYFSTFLEGEIDFLETMLLN